MKVAIIADPLDTQTAGIHTYTRHLVEGLRAYAPDIELVVVRPGPVKRVEPDEWIVPVNRLMPGHQRLRQFLAIPRLLNRRGIDVAIEPAHFGPFFLSDSIRRVTVIHDLTPLQNPDWHGWSSRLSHKWLLPGILKRADRVVAVSQQTASDITALFPQLPHSPVVIAPSIDQRFKPTTDETVLRKYGVTTPFLLHLGTLEPRKNLSLLIRAWESWRSTSTAEKVQLVLAGKWGWKTEELRQHIERSSYSSDILLPGFVPDEDLPALYSAAAALVVPSLHEGFGYPVAEALACGCKVLASGQAALREFEHDALEFFPADNPEGLAQLIAQLLGCQGLQTTEEKQGPFRQRYSLERMVQEWRVLLQDVISR